MGRTLYDKIWDAHVVREVADGALLYIDLHLLHEVTSPQAFAGLREAGRTVRQPSLTLAVADHNIPTSGQRLGIENVADPASRSQLELLGKNAREFGLEYFPMGDLRNGIVHVVGPEQGRTQPGMTIVCGDSHTSTHGALGALAHGIGTSEVEHVLATQTLRQKKALNMRVTVTGKLPHWATAKDLALAIIGKIGTGGGTGHVIEYAGEGIRELSMEGRMTLCNMTIEAGAKAGLIAPDEKTFSFLRGKPAAPQGREWDKRLETWRTLVSDTDAVFEREETISASEIPPMVTWGTSPEDALPITGVVPSPEGFSDPDKRAQVVRALNYMNLTPGDPLTAISIDRVFIGSCTNSRLEDLRSAAAIARGKKVAQGVTAFVVPGSGLVKAAAEAEGLDKIFIDAGFDWREPGCSLCVGLSDQLAPEERCASTSNRNFEGRQGPGSRTHLMSPAMAAAAAIAGHIVDVRQFQNSETD